MRSVLAERPPEIARDERTFQMDGRRGTAGMVYFIATEAALFAMLFFSYFFLLRGRLDPAPPKLTLALTMLAVLLTSSIVLHWGEKQIGRGRRAAARGALAATILIGVVFVGLQVFEYREHLETLTPRSNAYGSIFYAITSFHGLHLIAGLLMLAFVLMLPRIERADRPPHRAYHNAALYWHFVDAVWIVIVGLLYVAPNLQG